MAKTIIAVDRGRITSNSQNKTNEPVFIVRTELGRSYAYGVDILNADGSLAAKVVYDPDNKQDIGSRAWVETDLEVVLE